MDAVPDGIDDPHRLPDRKRVKETTAHRASRRQRQADRIAVKLAASCLRLAAHHGSDIPKILKPFVQRGGDEWKQDAAAANTQGTKQCERGQAKQETSSSSICLACTCGFTAGTDAALSRHLERAADPAKHQATTAVVHGGLADVRFNSSQERWAKKRVCKHFAGGLCKYGQTCYFLHPDVLRDDGFSDGTATQVYSEGVFLPVTGAPSELNPQAAEFVPAEAADSSQRSRPVQDTASPHAVYHSAASEREQLGAAMGRVSSIRAKTSAADASQQSRLVQGRASTPHAAERASATSTKENAAVAAGTVSTATSATALAADASQQPRLVQGRASTPHDAERASATSTRENAAVDAGTVSTATSATALAADASQQPRLVQGRASTPHDAERASATSTKENAGVAAGTVSTATSATALAADASQQPRLVQGRASTPHAARASATSTGKNTGGAAAAVATAPSAKTSIADASQPARLVQGRASTPHTARASVAKASEHSGSAAAPASRPNSAETSAAHASQRSMLVQGRASALQFARAPATNAGWPTAAALASASASAAWECQMCLTNVGSDICPKCTSPKDLREFLDNASERVVESLSAHHAQRMVQKHISCDDILRFTRVLKEVKPWLVESSDGSDDE